MHTRVYNLALGAGRAALVAMALTVAASSAHAQYGQRDPRSRGSGSYPSARATEVYEWRGRVDREVRVELRGSRASVRRAGSADGRRSAGRVLNQLPREDGVIRVERLDGRGDVDVIQQPSADNGYTAVLRLRDRSGGADDYHVVAYWQPTGSSYDRRDSDQRNGNTDGRYERRRRRHRDRDRDRDRDDDRSDWRRRP